MDEFILDRYVGKYVSICIDKQGKLFYYKGYILEIVDRTVVFKDRFLGDIAFESSLVREVVPILSGDLDDK